MGDLQVAEQVDVRQQQHACAVGGLRDRLHQALLIRQGEAGPLLDPELLQHLIVRIDEDVSDLGIHQDRGAIRHVQQLKGIHDDHGHGQGAGQDGDVRGDAAAHQDDGGRPFRGELEQIGREQPAREDDMVLVDVHLLAPAEEVIHQPQGQVLDIVGFFPGVSVVAGEETLHVVRRDLGDGHGRVDAAVDPPRDLAE